MNISSRPFFAGSAKASSIKAPVAPLVFGASDIVCQDGENPLLSCGLSKSEFEQTVAIKELVADPKRKDADKFDLLKMVVRQELVNYQAWMQRSDRFQLSWRARALGSALEAIAGLEGIPAKAR